MPSLFNPAVPTGTIELDEDYINLQNNFQQLSTSFQVNHVRLEDNSTSNGAHTFVEMRDQAGLPPALKAGEGTLYTKTAATVTDLWYTPDNSTNEYQLTRTSGANIAKFGTGLAYGTPPATFTQKGGWTFLPGGLLLQYGFFSKTGALGNSGTIQFPINFTGVPFSVTTSLVRPASGNQSLTVGIPTNSQFTFKSSSTESDGVYWQAIGK